MSLALLAQSIAAEVHAARERMRVYQLAALGTLDSALVMLEVAPGSARERLRADSESIKRNASTEIERMQGVAQQLAVKAVELSPGVAISIAQGFSTEMGLHIGRAMIGQVTENANQVDLMFSKIRLLANEYEIQGMPRADAIRQARTTAMKSFKFRFVDAIGRVRRVDDRVTTLVNGSLHQMVNELMVMGMVESKMVEATIFRPGHKTNGTTFKVTPRLSEFLALKDELFHPRSDALVAPIVSHG